MHTLLGRIALAVCAKFALISSQAQDAISSTPTLQDHLIEAYTLSKAQSSSLNAIPVLFEQLANEARVVQIDWQSRYGSGERNIEARLAAMLGARWQPLKTSIDSQLRDTLARRSQNVTPEEGSKFLKQVAERAEGALDPSFRRMLLASEPMFIQHPELEFAKGYTEAFSTKDHPKSCGVNLSLKCPISWLKQEGERPHIVQKWISDAGHGKESSILIQIVSLTELGTPTEEEMTDLFTADGAQGLLSDATLLSFNKGMLEQLPLGIAEYSRTSKRLDQEFVARIQTYYFVHQKALIILNLTCLALPSGNDWRTELKTRYTRLQPLMKLVVNSIVMPDAWRR